MLSTPTCGPPESRCLATCGTFHLIHQSSYGAMILIAVHHKSYTEPPRFGAIYSDAGDNRKRLLSSGAALKDFLKASGLLLL